MNNEFDPKLAQLFANSREPLTNEQFVQGVSIQIASAQRMSNLKTVACWLVLVLALVAATPWIVEGSAMLARSFNLALPYCGALMTSPVGWVLSMTVGLLAYRRARRLA